MEEYRKFALKIVWLLIFGCLDLANHRDIWGERMRGGLATTSNASALGPQAISWHLLFAAQLEVGHSSKKSCGAAIRAFVNAERC